MPSERVATVQIELRPATVDDIPDLAALAILAGHGLFEALYEGTIPDMPASKLVERRLHRVGTTKSYENCWVAVYRKQVIGSLNAYPQDDEAADPADPLIPKDRHHLFEPFLYLQAPGSLYINTIAVFPEYRGLGVGTRLLSVAGHHAHEIQLHELSLTTFEQNVRAVAFYERFGFKTVKRCPGAKHESIRYSGDWLLMTRPT